jgi:hypothetical protein
MTTLVGYLRKIVRFPSREPRLQLRFFILETSMSQRSFCPRLKQVSKPSPQMAFVVASLQTGKTSGPTNHL